MDRLHEKYENLKVYLKSLGSVAVAFSSGVDSTFLLKVAHDVLGDKAIAVTAASCSFPERELNEARNSVQKMALSILFVNQKSWISMVSDRIRRIDAIFANMSCLRRFGILPKRVG